MQRIEAVIFDMDGVIVDSEPLHERAFLDVFNEIGYGETHGVEFAKYYGSSDEALWLDFIKEHQPPESFEELIQRKRDRLLDLIRAEEPIFEGLPELVERLHHAFPLAVASGSSHTVIDSVLALGDLRRFFPIIVSVYDVARPKPAPDVFLAAADRLKMPPAQCCVIEDSALGVTAAREAGMSVIAITNTLPAARLQHADHVVKSYGEVASLLLSAPTVAPSAKA